MRRVVILQRHGDMIGAFMDALAATATRIGWTVRRMSGMRWAQPDEVAVVWNGRNFRALGPTLYCECGWLPRWDFQVSPAGINADSHVAPFVWDGRSLGPEDAAEVARRLEAIRQGGEDKPAYMQTGASTVDDLPEEFLLVPLQIEGDTNIQRHVPVRYRRMQALVDDIARADPPWPVIFKQHPADIRRGNPQLRLRLSRRRDELRPHDRGNIHQLLKSGRCRGIVSLNSNVVHDGLLWDVPAVVLGNNVWPRSGPGPFLNDLPTDWSLLPAHRTDPQAIACRQAYVLHLTNNQWTLADMHDPARVEELLSKLPYLAPAARPSPAARPRDFPAWPVSRTRRPLALARPPLPARREESLVSTRASIRPDLPGINVVAVNRGWFFEVLKQHFLAAEREDLAVSVSETPRPDAAAWIFIRTREAVASPDPARTVVQVHDSSDSQTYQTGGERACVAKCGAVVLTHPDQRRLLAHGGVNLTDKLVIDRPIGASSAYAAGRTLAHRFTVAWVGRPLRRRCRGAARVDWFIDALERLGNDLEVVLLGEDLEEQHRRLLRSHFRCRYFRRSLDPIDQHSRLYQTFDCVVIPPDAEVWPLCIFESLATGVPVVSVAADWAPLLVRDGENGYIVSSVEETVQAIERIRAERAKWMAKGEEIRKTIEKYTLESWVHANLDAALRLVQGFAAAAHPREAREVPFGG